MQTEQQKREQLLDALRSIDWYYDRSDDSRVYHAGADKHRLILALVKEVTGGVDLYRAHCPFGD